MAAPKAKAITPKKINSSVKKPNGEQSRCKVCSHEHLLEIETAFIVDKKSCRQVAEMLDTNGWEPVSHVTLLKHIDEHVDTRRRLIVCYLEDKRRILNNALQPDEDPETDELMVRLNELKKLDISINEANILVQQSSKALQEQLALRVEYKDLNGKVTGKSDCTLKDTDRKDASTKRAYVPIQRDLITLYKSASEELRQTIRTKLDTLGIDAETKKADNQHTLLDLILERENNDEYDQ